MTERQRTAAKLREHALKQSNGQELETTRPIKEIVALQEEQERVRAERLKRVGHSRDELEEQVKKIHHEVKALKKNVADSTKNFHLSQDMNTVRKSCFLEMRNRVTRDISRKYVFTIPATDCCSLPTTNPPSIATE